MREFEKGWEWSRLGTGHGSFTEVSGVAADRWNDRVQYFRRVEYGIEPCSLGRVKALFE